MSDPKEEHMEIIGIMGAMPDEVEQLCALLDGVTIEP